MIYVGVDNGIGTIGYVGSNCYGIIPTPIRCELDYTKTKKWISRLDHEAFKSFMVNLKKKDENILVVLERPMVNPDRFAATKTSLRIFEATIVVIEQLKIPYEYIDSKEWQRATLPSGIKKEKLKEASLSVAKRLFPECDFGKLKDADGLLIAKYRSTKK